MSSALIEIGFYPFQANDNAPGIHGLKNHVYEVVESIVRQLYVLQSASVLYWRPGYTLPAHRLCGILRSCPPQNPAAMQASVLVSDASGARASKQKSLQL